MNVNKYGIVILVPGIGLGGLEMLVLARRLRRLGHNTKIFWNSPWSRTVTAAAKLLHEMVTTYSYESVHFVGHSFGGLIVAQLFQDYPEQPPGRIITMGTPHNGSLAARRISALPFGPYLLGSGLMSTLARGRLQLPTDREIGSVAGKLNVLIGLFLGLPSPNDTLVTVEETLHPAITESIIVNASHATMLISRHVAQYIDSFLKTGTFGLNKC